MAYNIPSLSLRLEAPPVCAQVSTRKALYHRQRTMDMSVEQQNLDHLASEHTKAGHILLFKSKKFWE